MQKLMNLSKLSVRGKGLKFIPVKRPLTFTINSPGFDPADIDITVTGKLLKSFIKRFILSLYFFN